MPISLEESFAQLTDGIIARAGDLNQSQHLLQRFLEKHPDVLSTRFRTTYLQENLAELIHELIRTCCISEDNIELLADIVKNNQELNSAYRQHLKRIVDKPGGLAFANKNTEAVIAHIAKNIGRTWSFFGRQVGLPDAEMDEIQDEISDATERIEKIFGWAAVNIPQMELEKLIIRSLGASGRKDLSEEVTRIFDR
ncbi:Hypothetical predicted protein [Cloeon dipterum]|uniref:Death domain-containing protein n=1 Tax=Cloeon dipterum TaxID=197152 RepID=A0A8S1D964_9INSE|nr:Hypothetical predicted protein [Cloeon dipterum]